MRAEFVSLSRLFTKALPSEPVPPVINIDALSNFVKLSAPQCPHLANNTV